MSIAKLSEKCGYGSGKYHDHTVSVSKVYAVFINVFINVFTGFTIPISYPTKPKKAVATTMKTNGSHVITFL